MEKSMALGTAPSMCKRRKSDVYGFNLHDPFFDSYAQEKETLCDIMRRVDNCEEDLITLTFGTVFLRKILRSHLLHIKEIEKFL